MRHRVFVTGIGMVTPLGLDRHSTWQNLCAEQCAAKPISLFAAQDWPVNIACEVEDFELPKQSYASVHEGLINRPNKFALMAAYEAWCDSGLEKNPNTNIGVAIGSGIGAISPSDIMRSIAHYKPLADFSTLASYLETQDQNPHLQLRNHPAFTGALLAQHWNAQAFTTNTSTACAAGAQAIGHAYRRIADGHADIAFAGGTDSLSGEILLAGFILLGVLSKDSKNPQSASRPFDKNRSGFVASEGAAILILESEAHAKKRNARCYAEIIGFGESENAYRITDLPEDAHGAISSMRLALQDAKLDPKDINYINAHGTSTEQNDRVEALAIRKVFSDHGAHPFVSSSKSQLGHFVAAAGAVEAAVSILAVHHKMIPPNINLIDPIAELNFAKRTTPAPNIRYALSNSFGFGGSNASLIVGAP